MAKRNIRTNDPEDTTAPQRRRKAPAATPTAEASSKPRTRRKADAPVIEAAVAVESSAIETTPAPAPQFRQGEPQAFEITHEAIAERAYHIYLERGCTPGDPYQDWLTAERQLRERLVEV